MRTFISGGSWTPLSRCLGSVTVGTSDIIRFGIAICERLIECRDESGIYLRVRFQDLFMDEAGNLKLGSFDAAESSESESIYSAGQVLYVLMNEISNADRDALKNCILNACPFYPGRKYRTYEEFKEILEKTLEEVTGAGERSGFCRKCGSALLPDAGFCMNCGCRVRIFGSEPVSYPTDEANRRLSMEMSAEASMSWASEKAVPSKTEIGQVQFSAIAPKEFVKGEYTMIDIVMYEEKFRKIVKKIMAEAEEPVKETRSGYLDIARNTDVRIVLQSPDVKLEDCEEQGTWAGKYLNFSFAVWLPENYAKRQMLFIASVYFDGIIATKLKFTVKCRSLREQKLRVSREDVLSAFVSYASQDRSRVATLIQGMKKARPDMEIFFDVDSLRSGEEWECALRKEIEERDIFFLCWSHYAKASRWVDAEWHYALENKGIDCIEPVPIEPPNVCPPPKELESRHFNDKILYIIDAASKRS